MNQLQKFQDAVSVKAFGKTKARVHETGLCIKCGEPALPKCYSPAGRKEYQISGLCELCFDEITEE